MNENLEQPYTNHIILRDRVASALKLLYMNSLEAQSLTHARHLRSIDTLAHAKEFATIKMQTARRTGHSYAIAKLFENLENNWMVISPNRAMSKNIYNICRNEINMPCKKHDLYQLRYNNLSIFFEATPAINLIKFRGYNFRGVIVDCSFNLKKSEENKIYHDFLPFMKFNDFLHFIFVQ